MPARKHREGADLDEWLARKERFQHQAKSAREAVIQLSSHTLLRLDEAAIMMGMTKKTLREHEHKRIPGFPPRITLSPKITGFRLKDIETYIDSGMAPLEARAAE